jgi:hypothetical protein
MENTIPVAFQVMCKLTFEIRGNQRKKLDISYILSFVRQPEEALVKFKSPELGIYAYSLIGTGKPPQVFSPIVIETMIGRIASGSVDGVNPFPYKMSYSFAMNTESIGVFTLTSKKRVCILNAYGELLQSPFIFTPPTIEPFYPDIAIVWRDEIQWFFPLRGTRRASREVVVQALTGSSREEIARSISFALIGEDDYFEPSEYALPVIYPRGYDFVRNCLTVHSSEIEY